MAYLILFMEGIITFISPCILPMLPIYISYFVGDDRNNDGDNKRILINALGFVLGFTIIFTLLGVLAGTFGRFIKSHFTLVNIIGGSIMILFGLNYMEVFRIPLLQRSKKINVEMKSLKFISSVLFGMVFSIGWTPCVGTFLGSALMLAANSQETMKGTFMLLSYSIGLGVPFILSAILINQLKSTFNFIKRHYKTINIISGLFLIAIGLAMMTGYLNKLLSFLTL